MSGSLLVRVPQAVLGWSHSKKVQHCLSDSHKLASLYVRMLLMLHSQKRNYFVDTCSYIMDPHNKKTQKNAGTSKAILGHFPRQYFLIWVNIPLPLIMWSGLLFTVWLKQMIEAGYAKDSVSEVKISSEIYYSF